MLNVKGKYPCVRCWDELKRVITVQKMEIFIKDFFSKPDQIRKKLPMWSHLLKKSLMGNLIFLYSAWRLHCASFEWLLMVNDVIKSRWRSSVKKRIKTLTSPAGEAFVVTTEINMSAQIRLRSSGS